MKNTILWILVLFVGSFAIPKPMESIDNYNVLMVHGAYGKDQGFSSDGSVH